MIDTRTRQMRLGVPAALAMVLLIALAPGCSKAPTKSSPTEVASFTAGKLPTDDETRKQFDVWTSDAPPAGETPKFALNTSYPTTQPAAKVMPWEGIDFTKGGDETARYMKAVLSYCLEDAESHDFNFSGSTRWFHAPWLAREPLRGLTTEKSAKTGVLSPDQHVTVQNYAVGYYNEYGGWAFGQTWADRANPATSAGQFPVGTVSCKLLFTAATPAQVKYLRDGLVWRAAPRPPGATKPQPTDVRLLQLDIAVRDRRADQWTGWVFGTFMFLGDESGPVKPFSFGALTPVGLMWSNDQTLGPIAAKGGARATSGWLNPVVAAKISAIRGQTAGLSRDLGLYGRVNGPVDDSNSACLACHGRALDGGAGWTSAQRTPAEPFSPSPAAVDPSQPPDGLAANDVLVRNFFRDLKSNQPYLSDTATTHFVALDYSLQMAVGLENFHKWRMTPLPSANPLAQFFSSKAAASRTWIDAVPDARLPKRGE